jgi:hypothetical protein
MLYLNIPKTVYLVYALAKNNPKRIEMLDRLRIKVLMKGGENNGI